MVASQRSQRGTAKGAIVRPMVEWLVAEHGDGAALAVAERLPPRWRAFLRLDAPALGLVYGRWYDEELASALAAEVLTEATRCGDDRAAALDAIGARTVAQSLGRLGRVAVGWFASPETTAICAQMFWRLYHSRGTISASVHGDRMHAVGDGWGAHGEAWCAIVGASAVEVLRLAGCVAPRLERHLCTGGSARCEMTLSWRR